MKNKEFYPNNSSLKLPIFASVHAQHRRRSYLCSISFVPMNFCLLLSFGRDNWANTAKCRHSLNDKINKRFVLDIEQ